MTSILIGVVWTIIVVWGLMLAVALVGGLACLVVDLIKNPKEVIGGPPSPEFYVRAGVASLISLVLGAFFTYPHATEVHGSMAFPIGLLVVGFCFCFVE